MDSVTLIDTELFTPEGERVISTIFEANELEELLRQDSEDSFPVFDKVLWEFCADVLSNVFTCVVVCLI